MRTAAKDVMRALAIDRFGGIDVLRVQTLPRPEPAANEVLIRVEAAGVGTWDPFEREGGFAELAGGKPTFPYVLGSDGAGVVLAVGADARRFRAGDRVYGVALFTGRGFHAELAAVAEDAVAPVPEKLTLEQAGAMPVVAVTALRGLEDTLALQQGETVMVLGASGGVGHVAVQLAKRLGARVLAVASGEDGVALARRVGADAVVEGKTGDVVAAARELAPGGVDAALLTAGGVAAQRALEAVRDGGRAAYPNGVEPAPEARGGVRVQAFDGEVDAAVLARLDRLIQAGPFEVHVARAYPLERAAEAHRALGEHFLGKLVLRPGSGPG